MVEYVEIIAEWWRSTGALSMDIPMPLSEPDQVPYINRGWTYVMDFGIGRDVTIIWPPVEAV